MKRQSIIQKIADCSLHSPAMQRMTDRTDTIWSNLEDDPRRVIPVAAVARAFGVSARLLWNWIGMGLIKTQPARDGALKMKRGITKRKVRNFLERLREYGASELDAPPSRAGRPAHARESIRAARDAGLPKKPMGAMDFAACIGVSSASVLRAFKDGELPGWYVSGIRIMIGKPPPRKRRR